jgi:hypothetical protein
MKKNPIQIKKMNNKTSRKKIKKKRAMNHLKPRTVALILQQMLSRLTDKQLALWERQKLVMSQNLKLND